MADYQVGLVDPGFNAAAGTQQNGGTNAQTGHWDADYNTVAAMRTRLAAISAGTYTAAYLNRMTVNDMVYAIRVNDSIATIAGK